MQRRYEFRLSSPDSLDRIKDVVGVWRKSICTATVKCEVCPAVNEMTDEDKQVIVDAFLERLPAVWQDAEKEIKDGTPLATVVQDMRSGHVLRILRRLGWDPEEFIDEFKEYMSGTP